MPLPSFTNPIRRFALVAGCVLPLAGPAVAQESAGAGGDGEPVAVVNGVEIGQGQYEIAAEHLVETLSNVPEAARREQVVSYLIDLEVLAQAAEEAGVDEEAVFRNRLEYAEKRALMEIFLAREATQRVDDQAVRDLYDEVIASVEPQTEVRARHILVETEEEAAEIAAELEEGADFAELAEERSTDPGSAARGGDLGYFTRERMVPAFAETAFAMEPGEVSEPVESQFGWHVIKVEDKREQEQASFEELEDELRSAVDRRARAEVVRELRAEAEIEQMGPSAADDSADDSAPVE